eukprot:gene18697-58385_t
MVRRVPGAFPRRRWVADSSARRARPPAAVSAPAHGPEQGSALTRRRDMVDAAPTRNRAPRRRAAPAGRRPPCK